MALMTSPLTKSKPCLFLPFTHAKKLGSPPAILLNYGHYNHKFLPLTTNKCKKEKLSSLLDASDKNYSSTKKALQVLADADSVPLSEAEPRNLGKIFLSDVVVRRRRQVFWGRKWNSSDIVNAGVISAVHFLSLFGPFYFTWPAFWVALGIGIVTGLLGITLSFHRNLSHRSFKLPKWLEYFFAYCGVQALQRDPIFWVSTHRHHHQFCDSERDPHSPTEGFWFSHITWLFDNNYITEKCGGQNNVGDLEKQPFYKFMQNTYFLHPIALGVLLYAVGGFPFLVWGMGVRTVLVFHITWLVNSVSHLWGKRAWNTGDLSRNNWWLALLTFGEGWHNNHHAFEYSARHGLEWWQIDMTWYVVRFLQAIGLATDVKLPSEVQKQRMAFKN
ncbi:palmitoyl-monogalactosyldiacylglycerol delta-7 desaturase, chloroplastic-like [Populus nigra]|uniref:palmitoyl-monogalactosyldiacylglycerol delta-7 desaturase, chloroplastic-like n=1 Tax=Populus nigra TaxID=3691 RepID=UPI002B26C7E8|nr:palmitoyl-monogalactosyldiacylglycerol delta-7 desaturase, chloroplastic-like [Populus nigra]